MSDRPAMMTVQERTIPADEKLKNRESNMPFPGPSLRRVDRFEKPSFRSLEPACDTSFKVRFQWLYGGKVTSTVSFDRSILQLEPSAFPACKSVRKSRMNLVISRMELPTELS